MSIDREINSRVNAYSSNPQALQKKYSMSKDLVDLLALQKIKKGMDEERRNIAMAMQTNPATIKQQREQEVFGRTAQDVAQQLGGVLQTAKNQQMARRRPAPQGLGALMPQQGQRPQQPQTRMMQAGGIVAFDGTSGSRVSGPPKTQEEQIQYLIDQNLTDEQIRAEVKKLGLLPQAADQIIQQVRSKRLSVAPPGMMEEVVVTGQREPSPLSAEGMMREQEKTKQTKDKNIAEIPVPKDITPARPTAKKGAPQFTEVDGVRRQVNPDGSLVVMPAADTAPTMLEYMRQGGLDKIKEKYLAGTPLSQNEIKMYDEYGPGMASLEGQFGSGKASGIAAVAEETTGTSQVQPLRAEGVAAIADDTTAKPTQDRVETEPQPKTAPQPETAPPTAPQGFDLQGKLDEVGDAPGPVMVDREGLEKRGVDFTKAYGVDPASIDPEARGVAALQKAEDYYGVKEKDAELRKGLADLAALDAAQTDPDKLRRDRLKSFLLGGAGRGSSTLAGAGAASMNLGRAQESDIHSRQIKRNEMLKTIQDQDLKVRELAKGEERAAIERADRIKMDGLKIISNMSNAELSARQTEANAINQSNIANYKGKMERVGLLLEQSNDAIDQAIERAKLASTDAQRRGQIAQSGIDDAMRRKSDISKILEATYRDQVNADPTILSLRNSLADPDLSDEEAGKVNAAIKKRLADIKANLAVAQQADLDEMNRLDDKILELENLRNTALGGGVSDIALPAQEESLVGQYNKKQ